MADDLRHPKRALTRLLINNSTPGGHVRLTIRSSVAAIALAVSLTACGAAATEKDATGVIQALADQGLPIKLATSYTAESDPNKLLGRPGQYTSKASFTDSRIKATNTQGSVGNGGGVEVFADASEAEKRADYIKAIAGSSPMFSEYTYLSGNVVVRVSKELVPQDAVAYESALGKIVE